jgi:hypothetical protein
VPAGQFKLPHQRAYPKASPTRGVNSQLRQFPYRDDNYFRVDDYSSGIGGFAADRDFTDGRFGCWVIDAKKTQNRAQAGIKMHDSASKRGWVTSLA